jgi:hypothetical protein
MEQQDGTDNREEDVDMITIPAEAQAGLSSTQGNGIAKSSTAAAAGTAANATLKPTSAVDGQPLPIRTGKFLYYVADLFG